MFIPTLPFFAFIDLIQAFIISFNLMLVFYQFPPLHLIHCKYVEKICLMLIEEEKKQIHMWMNESMNEFK